MKIGFPNHPRKNIYDEVEWIGENDFNFVDLFLEEDLCRFDKVDPCKINQLLTRYNLSAVGHTGFYWEYGHQSKELRELSVVMIEKYLDTFAKIKNLNYVTVHASWPTSMYSDEEGIAWQIESLKKICSYAKKKGLEIIYEPLDGKRDSVENVEKILNGAPDLQFHLDIGHANLFGKKPQDFIKKFAKQLKHVHLHDNNGFEDQHLAPGKGNIGWTELIKYLKANYDGTITLEIFNTNEKDILTAQKLILGLWEKS